MMKYITFIGRNTYNKTNYYLEYNQEISVETEFVQEFIVEKFKDRIDTMYVFQTEQCKDNFEMLKERLGSKVNIQAVYCDAQDSVEELLERMNGCLNDKDQVIIDITNAFRNIPFSVCEMLPYLQISKKIRISHIFYGRYSFDHKDRTPVTDIIVYYENSKIIDYLKQFSETMRIPSVKDVNWLNNKEIKILFNYMREIPKQINLSSIMGTMAAIKVMYDQCYTMLQNNELSVFHHYLKQILESYHWINEENIFLRVNHLVRHTLRSGYYQYAITVLERNSIVIITSITIANGKYKNSQTNKIDENSRDISKSLDSLVLANLKVNKTIDEYTELPLEVRDDLYDLYISGKSIGFRSIRNRVNHGDHLEATEVDKAILNFAEIWDSIASKYGTYQNEKLYLRPQKNLIVKKVGDTYEIYDIFRKK